jgi:hypothetical protein
MTTNDDVTTEPDGQCPYTEPSRDPEFIWRCQLPEHPAPVQAKEIACPTT